MSVPPVALIGLRRSAVPLAILFALALIPSLSQSQTLTILHAFRGTDGAFPESGVTMDREGNLYGTTFNLEGSGYGQAYNCNTRVTVGYSIDCMRGMDFMAAVRWRD